MNTGNNRLYKPGHLLDETPGSGLGPHSLYIDYCMYFQIQCLQKHKVNQNSFQLMNGRFGKENLGFGHITRETVIQKHTRPLVQTRFGDAATQRAILVLNGTYIYTKKSGNFKF